MQLTLPAYLPNKVPWAPTLKQTPYKRAFLLLCVFFTFFNCRFLTGPTSVSGHDQLEKGRETRRRGEEGSSPQHSIYTQN